MNASERESGHEDSHLVGLWGSVARMVRLNTSQIKRDSRWMLLIRRVQAPWGSVARSAGGRH